MSLLNRFILRYIRLEKRYETTLSLSPWKTQKGVLPKVFDHAGFPPPQIANAAAK